MDDYRNQLNKWDYILSVASGAITATIDVLLVKDISLRDAHKWGAKETEEFVIKAANAKGYKGKELAGAVKWMEDLYPISADKLTNDFGGGAYHHLRDFSHHPTIFGLLFSVVSQFTGKVYGTDPSGRFLPKNIPGWTQPDFMTGVYNGTVTWLFHMISDVAGSSSSIQMGKEGTGLPGPLMAFLKEMSSIPLVRSITETDEKGNNEFSVICSKLFSGTLLGERDENGKIIKGGELKFDFRTELGISHEAVANKLHLPVIINEIVVCSFYSVSRLCDELKRTEIHTVEDLKLLDIKAFLPWDSVALRHMRTIASVTFTTIDISVAGTRAAVKNKGNPNGFALDFLQSINYFGLGHLTIAASGELTGAISKLYGNFAELVEAQKQRLYAANPNAEESVALLKKTGVTAGAIFQAGTPLGFISAAIGVYDEIAVAVKELNIAHKNRVIIEEQCRASLQIIKENQAEMEMTVSQYMFDYLTGFGYALDNMESALSSGDAEQYLQGNAVLQRQLGKKANFDSLDDFETLMASDTPLKM